MVPSAAVIPDPIDYIKVVAVKNCIAGLLVGEISPTLRVHTHIVSHHNWV